MDASMSIAQVKEYIEQLEQLRQEFDFAYHEMRHWLEQFQDEPTPESVYRLQSSVAHFEKIVLPFIGSKKIDVEYPLEDEGAFSINIDGRWGAYEFRQFFDGIDYLGKVYTIRYKMERRSPDVRLQEGMTRSRIYRTSRLHYYLSPREELRVRKIEFASPGLVSLEGVGEVIKELRELFDYVITFPWIKQIIDNFFGIRDRINLRQIEVEIRRIEARARASEAQAKEYESIRRAVEEKSKMKKAIRQFVQEQNNQQRLNSIEPGIERIEELSDFAVTLQTRGLARLPDVENSIMRSLSHLYRLSYEQQKIATRKKGDEQ